MVLKTTLENLEEFMYKYYNLLGWSKGGVIPDNERPEIHLGIADYRIQIPELNISLRDGDLMSQNEEDGQWEVDSEIVLLFDLNEKDSSKYLGWSTGDYDSVVYDYLEMKHLEVEDVYDLECIIDTSDFIDEASAQRYAKECEDEYRAEYGDDEEDEDI